jgi:hypothetical protein
MTGVPDGVALGLGSGQALVGPIGALTVARALEAVERSHRRDGIPPPAHFVALRAVFDAAAAEARRSERGRADGPPMPVLPTSGLFDPIDSSEAALLLGVTSRQVRRLCGSGAFASARRSAASWWLERDEVVARSCQDGRATAAAYELEEGGHGDGEAGEGQAA